MIFKSVSAELPRFLRVVRLLYRLVFCVNVKNGKMKRLYYNLYPVDFLRIPFALAEEIRHHEQSYKIM